MFTRKLSSSQNLWLMRLCFLLIFIGMGALNRL
jgi:hypothetical protein